MANANPRWLAPEIINGHQASTASDVYAYGIVLWGASMYGQEL